MKVNKYKNIKTEVDGIMFDSKKEAKRYGELKLLEKAGAIRGLKLQPKLPIEVNGIKVCTYIGDFEYIDTSKDQVVIIEDVKSTATKTRIYSLKKKLVKAVYGIEILET